MEVHRTQRAIVQAVARLARLAPDHASVVGAHRPVEGLVRRVAIDGQLDSAALAKMVGYEGEQNGAVYKITIGRDDVKLVEMGASINARMGLNTWAAFVGTNEKAAIAGDVAMLESEVTAVLKALRTNGLDVVAIHHHMTSDRPMIIFLHYWGTGPADKLATSFKAALNEAIAPLMDKGVLKKLRRA